MTNTKIVTGKARLSFPSLFEPKAMPGAPQETAKYSASLIIPKSDTETLNKIQQAINSATEIGKADKFGGKVPPNLKTTLRDGDVERPDDPAYADSYFLNVTSKRKPGLVDQRKQPITDETELYAGCYVRASINFYAYNANGNKGISAGLNNMQKWAEGEPLSGGTTAEEDFDEIEVSEEDLNSIF